MNQREKTPSNGVADATRYSLFGLPNGQGGGKRKTSAKNSDTYPWELEGAKQSEKSKGGLKALEGNKKKNRGEWGGEGQN